MKKLLSIMMGVSLIFLLTACSSTSVSKNNSNSGSDRLSTQKNEQSDDTKTGDNKLDKALVVYFSCTGNTEKVANLISKSTGADIYEIVPEEEYTSEDLDYNNPNSRVSKEHEDLNIRPKILGSIDNMNEYNTIFIGYPIWWGEAPRIMSTFIESYDFSKKTIIPFCTSGSSSIGNSADDLKQKSSNSANWLEGQRFSGNVTTSEINQWIKSLKIN